MLVLMGMALTCLPNEIVTDFGCLPDSPAGFVGKFYTWGLGLIGLVGLLFLIIGGYHILISRGDPSQLQTGKSRNMQNVSRNNLNKYIAKNSK